jgi:hypothetical protein
MAELLTLRCPIRGVLKASAKSADGLTPSEEKLRIDAIRYLIGKGYPKDTIRVETVIKKFGEKGRNSFRADLAVLDIPVSMIAKGDGRRTAKVFHKRSIHRSNRCSILPSGWIAWRCTGTTLNIGCSGRNLSKVSDPSLKAR